jgi:hypothetical protein
MFKTRFGGNAFFYFVKFAAEVLVSFGKLFIAAATLAAYYQRSSSSIMDLLRSSWMREKTGSPVGDRWAEEMEMLGLVLTFLYV